MPFESGPIFSAHVARALAYRAAGDITRFTMYCAGLRAQYRKQRRVFQVEDGPHFVAFQISDPRTGIVFARYLHRDPVAVKLTMPGRMPLQGETVPPNK